ncbi:hypothetical protein [Allorhodopirellula solitaria]|uniref:Transmembrane protein n=1 Tax=Allorhodopirellula solitaria TaxID=2527987 RepID=A0A5C5YGR0_9BACT|nr:hypothetical protein [Allorhodopirellula solitaria]TWT74133.1 hypothetical protein CA85_10190 [Allorhodopirellula solitaria]
MSQPPTNDGDATDGMAAELPVRGESDESARPVEKVSANEEPVRRGSPFAHSSEPSDTVSSATPELVLDPQWGVLRAANWASAWVAICALACLGLFPAGGVIVATLGCALATVGLFSSRVIAAAMLLGLHAWIFFACYQRLF